MADSGDSIFTKIIKGEIPCQRVFENDRVLAFLDITPLSEGHTLVVPKHQAERFEDLPAEDAAAIASVLGRIAQQVTAAVDAPAYNILLNNGKLAGQEVPHVHFHIIPRRPDDELGYRWNASPANHDALAKLAERIREGLSPA